MIVLERGEETLGGTPGIFLFDNRLLCGSLELPWRENEPFVSCVPCGTYTIRWTLSTRLNGYTWQLMDVPGREGIRIHAANFLHEIEGCIAPGDLDTSYPTLTVHRSDGALKMLDQVITSNNLTQLAILPAGSRS